MYKAFHNETGVDGFTYIDGTLAFYSFVKSIYLKFDSPPRVLDLGAGRGWWVSEDYSRYIPQLRDLRNGAAHVVAADVDEAVLENKCSHEQVIIEPGKPLPFEDGAFDIVVSDYVFEHITDAKAFADEIYRVLKPGGWVCARTANRFGYVSLLTSLIPNKLHVALLKFIQPSRKEVDVFPTAYKLNNVWRIRKAFSKFDVYHFRNSGEPCYYFGNRVIYGLMLAFHAVLPRILATGLNVFMKKRI